MGLPVPVKGIINSGKKELLEQTQREKYYSVLGFEFKNRLLKPVAKPVV